MNRAPMPASATRTAKKAIATAGPRRRMPWACSQTTAGLIASARKTEMRIQVRTWREIQSSSSAAATASTIASVVRIVRGGKWTTRSGRAGPGSACTGGASLPGRTFTVRGGAADRGMSLRGSPVVRTASLPSGEPVEIRVGVPDDSYIPKRELELVTVELRLGGRHVAVVDTILEPEQDAEAQNLAREIARGLESGELEPTAGSLERLPS